MTTPAIITTKHISFFIIMCGVIVSLTRMSNIFFSARLMNSIKIGAVALIADDVTAESLDKA